MTYVPYCQPPVVAQTPFDYLSPPVVPPKHYTNFVSFYKSLSGEEAFLEIKP